MKLHLIINIGNNERSRNELCVRVHTTQSYLENYDRYDKSSAYKYRCIFEGPITGGEMVRAIGFPWVMRIVGIVNVAYCPLLLFLTLEQRKLLSKKEEEEKNYDTFQKSIAPYERFHDSDNDL